PLTFPERRLAASEAATLVREQAREAIRLRLAGVVAGFLLSGGLDAAALLALVAADRRSPASAYTATFAGEGRAAARLAAQLGIEHVAVDGEPEWPAVLEHLLAAHGGPGASLDDPVLALAAARAAADVRVALAGVGGDEIFGGSAPARAAARIGYYARLPALAREMIEVSTRVAPALWSPAVHATVGGARLAPLELYARPASLLLPEERAPPYPPEGRGGVRARQLLLGAATADLLPRAVRSAPHRDPGPPPQAWAAGRLRDLAEELLAPRRLAAQGVFRPDHVGRLWREHLAGERDHGRRLWGLLAATRWLEGRVVAASSAARAAG